MNKLTVIAIAAFAVLLTIYQSAFIVTQTEQVLVLRFGQVVRVVQTPGLQFKVPFVDNIRVFDKRLLVFNAPPQEFITKDRLADVEERVVIDAYVPYRIVDPVKFLQAAQGSETVFESRLNSIVISNMRKIIASNSLNDLLSDQRAQIMQEIKEAVNRQATSETVAQFEEYEASKSDDPNATTRRRRQGFGVEVIDVRIMRADLPQDISQATYERMRKNFTKEAQRFRAEGEEKALEIRSNADRERVEILAEARKTSETLRGEGDGEAARIYADAFTKDKEFFKFYRTMQAYRKTLTQDDTTLILSPNSEFLKELQ